jgi:hypothetical protein
MLNWAEATFLVVIASAEADRASSARGPRAARSAPRRKSFLDSLFSRRAAATPPAAEHGTAGGRRLAA